MEDGLKVTKIFLNQNFRGFLMRAKYMDTAEVYQNAKIYNKAIVRGDADISGNVRIYNFAKRGLTFLKHEKMKYV